MTGTSISITVFPLSTLGGGDSEITGFTKIVYEVEGVSEVEGGTYPSLVLSVGHF
jgi:hypothetical protein